MAIFWPEIEISARFLFSATKYIFFRPTNILHKNGTISMARLEPGTASSEFFICINDQPELDYGGKRNPDGQGFAEFGQVIKGMEIVKKIQMMDSIDQILMVSIPVKIKIQS